MPFTNTEDMEEENLKALVSPYMNETLESKIEEIERKQEIADEQEEQARLNGTENLPENITDIIFQIKQAQNVHEKVKIAHNYSKIFIADDGGISGQSVAAEMSDPKTFSELVRTPENDRVGDCDDYSEFVAKLLLRGGVPAEDIFQIGYQVTYQGSSFSTVGVNHAAVVVRDHLDGSYYYADNNLVETPEIDPANPVVQGTLARDDGSPIVQAGIVKAQVDYAVMGYSMAGDDLTSYEGAKKMFFGSDLEQRIGEYTQSVNELKQKENQQQSQPAVSSDTQKNSALQNFNDQSTGEPSASENTGSNKSSTQAVPQANTTKPGAAEQTETEKKSAASTSALDTSCLSATFTTAQYEQGKIRSDVENVKIFQAGLRSLGLATSMQRIGKRYAGKIDGLFGVGTSAMAEEAIIRAQMAHGIPFDQVERRYTAETVVQLESYMKMNGMEAKEISTVMQSLDALRKTEAGQVSIFDQSYIRGQVDQIGDCSKDTNATKLNYKEGMPLQLNARPSGM